LAPVLVDEGHVGREVVVHVELSTLGVDDLGEVSVVEGGPKESEGRALRRSFQQALWRVDCLCD
jgi:hypothetical protein